MIRLATSRGVLFGAMLVVALIAFLPMRLVLGAAGLGDAGLTARRAAGSVWAGRLDEAGAAGFALGDLRASLSPLRLLTGEAHLRLESADAAALRPLAGALGVSRHALGAEHVTASLPAGNLFAPLPVTALDLDDVTVRFRDNECEHAEGRVRAVLAGDVAGVPLTGQLSGDARCEAGALLLPLASASGAEQVRLRVTSDARYAVRLQVAAPDPATAAKLAQLGFQQGPGGYAITAEGRF